MSAPNHFRPFLLRSMALSLACFFLACSPRAVVDPLARVDSLIGSMTLEEKLTFLRGAQDPAGESGAGYMPGVPRLNIPPLRLADGPAGIRTGRPATALPAPVALASTFDPTLALAFGKVLGHEGRARNQDVLLSPMVNIVRVPHAGRNFETFSEDPLLSARMVAEEVRGVEGEHLIATVKHYIANNFENDRNGASADLSERVLHEVYLPGFEAAIRAGAGAVMCSYNRVNGVYACDHAELLTGILREELGFEGWVMTDWGARHSMDALEHGLDQEMPGGRGSSRQGVYFGDSLAAAVEEGRIPLGLVDQAVRRILGQMGRMGLLDGSAPARPELDEDAGAEVALAIAEAGGVLLRNEGSLLPLSPESLGSVLVVGPTARTPLIGGGGSSRVSPLRRGSFLQALEERVPTSTPIRFLTGMDLDGVPIPPSALEPPPGLEGDRRGLLRSTAEGEVVGPDPMVSFTGDEALPAGSSWSWTGSLTVATTGEYEIKLQTAGGRADLSLDGSRMVSTGGFGRGSLIPTMDDLGNTGATLHLEAGVPHDLSLTASSSVRVEPGGVNTEGDPLQIRLAWITPEGREASVEEAAGAAREATVVVLFAHQEGTEGADRPSLSLPGVQDDLIARVAQANPNTVVVMNTGAPTLMPWIEEVGAVLQMWYPGQEGGEATAALLLGEANPRGKLPVTFPRDESRHATGDPRRYPGVDGHAAHDEGLMVGYRWFDEQGVDPLFPFGHGLSYTTFSYSDLTVRPEGEGFEVSFTLANAGGMAGIEVPQLYLGPPDSPPVPMAPSALVDFRTVELAPRESRRVTLEIGDRALSYWSEAEEAWVVAPGTRSVSVGSSSRDIHLRGVTGG